MIVKNIALAGLCLVLSSCSDSDCAVVELLKNERDISVRELDAMLQSGLRIDCRNAEGYTLLGRMVSRKDIDSIELLLDKYNADPNFTDGGASPLYIAALIDCKQCATLLVESGGTIIGDEKQQKFLFTHDHIQNDAYWLELLSKQNVKP